MSKVRSLELPNGEIKDYFEFNEYEKDFNHCIDQMKWKINNNKDSDERKKLNFSILNLKTKVLFNQQKNKFNCENIDEWQKTMDRLSNLAKGHSESDLAIKDAVNKLSEQYSSNDLSERNKGRLNFRIAVIEAFGEDYDFMKDWDEKMFHGNLEISDVLRKLYFNKKLDQVLSKFI